MLGLSIKEKLYKIITYFYKIHIDEYIENVKEIINKKDTLSESEINRKMGKILIVLLYGIKKRQPKPKECSALDLVQHEMLRKRLVALDTEYNSHDSMDSMQDKK